MTPLKWTREALDLTQREIGNVLGASEPTVRAVESQRINLSPKFATRLAAQTGLDAKWLTQRNLGNDPLPSAAEVRTRFSEAKKGSDFSPGGQVSEALAGALLLRAYVLQSLIVDELGYAGCHHTGYFDELQNMNVKLLGRIPNRRARQRIFQQSRDIIDGGIEEITKHVEKELKKLQEITAAVRSSTKKTY